MIAGMKRAVLSIALLLVALGQLAAAQEQPDVDPDTAAARRHFKSGLELYNNGRYIDAIHEFAQANLIKAAPAFDYNIARCLERLEKWEDAAVAYEKYIQGSPGAKDLEDTRQRVAVLRSRVPAKSTQVEPPHNDVNKTATPESPSTDPQEGDKGPGRLRLGAWAVGGLALVSLVVGTALVASVSSPYDTLSTTTCVQRQCSSADWSDLQTRANIGYALWGVGVVALAADVVLWVMATRSARAATHAWLVPAQGGLFAGGTF